MVFLSESVSSLCPLQAVLVFPCPGAVSVQDVIQCLRDQTSDKPCIKRLKSATHAAENPESETSDEAKGLESS